MRRIYGMIGAILVAGATLVGCSDEAHAGTATWACQAPGLNYYVTTTNQAYLNYLSSRGWHCFPVWYA